MRTIKFRVWDKQNKEMINLREAECATTMGSHFAIVFEEYGHTIDGDKEYFDRFELMQYTGLLDKNGREIFERDVVSFQSEHNPDAHYRAVVEWSNDNAGFHVNINNGQAYSLIFDEIQVIGNIFENPELLNQES